jgi:gliding motility-associated-like protein
LRKYLKIAFFLFFLVTVRLTVAQETIALNTYHSFETSFQPGYTYSWWFVDETGTQTFFNSNTNTTEQYYWEIEGNYELFAQAKDENGCLSEIISKPFVVKEEAGIQTLFALADFFIGFENNPISGDISTNDFHVLDSNINFVYSVWGDNLPGLNLNPDGTFNYQPPQGFVGEISFTYLVCFDNDTPECETAEVEFRILPSNPEGNVAPVAVIDFALTFPNQAVISNLLENDIDPDGNGDPLTITTYPVIEPENGVVVILDNGNFTYTPNQGFEGIDKFMYRVCDNGSPVLCDSAWAYIIVSNYANVKPIAISDDIFLYSVGTVFNLAENDYDLYGQALVYNATPITTVQNGVLELTEDGLFSYIPDSGFVGIDWFVYEACIAGENPICGKATGFIIVTSFGYREITLAGSDTTIGSCNTLTLGELATSNENLSYLWEPGTFLDDSTSANPIFTPGITTEYKLTVTNVDGLTAIDSVQITVLNVTADAGEDVYKYGYSPVFLDGSGSSGLNLQHQWTTSSGLIESGENTSTPEVSGFGEYWLAVTDQFGCVDYDTVIVGMIIYEIVANDDYDSTALRAEVKIEVLENDYDPENRINLDSFKITIPPENGTATINYEDYTIQYRPNNTFSGFDNFEYQICDSFNNCDRAMVFVFVSEFNFIIPEAFSPNGDNINDYFEIIGIEWYEGNYIEIYNRWGHKVYQASNYGINIMPKFWDGKPNIGIRLGNEDLPSGTYFYVLDLANGEPRIAGSVYLDR